MAMDELANALHIGAGLIVVLALVGAAGVLGWLMFLARTRYARPNHRIGERPPDEKIPLWQVK